MDALAEYSSDEDSNSVKDQNEAKKKSGGQGDNYENVTMDLSEGSDDNKESSSRPSKDRERSKSGRHEKRHHKNKHSRREDRERRDNRREDRHRSDRDRKYSRRSRSRSRSPRRRSRSRERHRDRNRDHKSKRSPPAIPEVVPSSSAAINTAEKCRPNYLNSGSLSEAARSSGVLGEKDRSISPPAAKSQEAIQLSSGIVPGLTNNPTLSRIQEQLQKRRALWSTKSAAAKETCAKSGNNWESTTLPKDNDGKMTAKFKRLMGMKGVEAEPEPRGPKKPPAAAEQHKQQDEMFNKMERQYEVARLATHSYRGIGLGFGTFQCNPR
ncbi:Hypothetical predicted protein [Cloeon dipterum]|uniref:Small acidic protein-like domain-containing protein n=1 Tax=Cloeon dipterum TaxID=197152 RepID=A0A8S1CGW9_9INSE|nr:Hypothetical predicted protein [Cloeon dipterum]